MTTPLIAASFCVLTVAFFVVVAVKFLSPPLPRCWDEQNTELEDVFNGIRFDCDFWESKYKVDGAEIEEFGWSDWRIVQTWCGHACAYEENEALYKAAKKKASGGAMESTVFSFALLCLASAAFYHFNLFPNAFLVKHLNYLLPAVSLAAIAFSLGKAIDGKYTIGYITRDGDWFTLGSMASSWEFHEEAYNSVYNVLCIDKEKYPPIFFFAMEAREAWFLQAVKQIESKKKIETVTLVSVTVGVVLFFLALFVAASALR